MKKRQPSGQQEAQKTKPTGALSRLLPDVALFFSLGAADFSDVIVVTKVVAVVLPLRHLRDRGAVQEVVLKKLLHRPFEPSAQEIAQPSSQLMDGEGGISVDERCGGEAAMSPFPPTAAPVTQQGSTLAPSPSPAPRVILHIKKVEVRGDTARQINPRGDVQVNCLVTFVAARVRHGLSVGVAEVSPFESCVQVRVPSVTVSRSVAAGDVAAEDAAVMPISGASPRISDGAEDGSSEKVEGGDEATVDAHALSPSGDEGQRKREKRLRCDDADDDGVSPGSPSLRVTARCLAEEPVTPGQAVLLICEPAVMRCMAVRPPRPAPGPFLLRETVELPARATPSSPQRVEEREGRNGQRKPRKSRSSSSGAGSTNAVPRRIVSIECAIPEKVSGC